MKKSKNAVSIIGGSDGPTAVFIAGKNKKIPLKQRMRRFKYKIKRVFVEKTLKCRSHSMDEVIKYIARRYGFIEVNNDSGEIDEEYRQMKSSFLIQHAPELLGEYAESPQLTSKSPEDIKTYLKQNEERIQKASEIPPAVFDIDFHKLVKTFDDINDSISIIIEKRYSYIGGGASGNKKLIRKFSQIYKDIYRYYGVTKEDKENKTDRYRDVVRILSR